MNPWRYTRAKQMLSHFIHKHNYNAYTISEWETVTMTSHAKIHISRAEIAKKAQLVSSPVMNGRMNIWIRAAAIFCGYTFTLRFRARSIFVVAFVLANGVCGGFLLLLLFFILFYFILCFWPNVLLCLSHSVHEFTYTQVVMWIIENANGTHIWCIARNNTEITTLFKRNMGKICQNETLTFEYFAIASFSCVGFFSLLLSILTQMRTPQYFFHDYRV